MSEVTVVVGAGSIGQAIARRVSAGKHVVVADLHQANADAAAEVLGDAGFQVSTATVDVASRASLHTPWSTRPPGLARSPGSSTPPGCHPARHRRRRSWPWTCTAPRSCWRSSPTSSPVAGPGSSSRRSPGIIFTPLAQDELTGPRGAGYRRMLEGSPVGRGGTPDEVATVAALLLGPDGGFVTGSDVLMDGGVTASWFYGDLAPR